MKDIFNVNFASEDNLRLPKSFINRRNFFRVVAYTSCTGVGLVLPYLVHKEDRSEAVVPLIVIPVVIFGVAVLNKDQSIAWIKTTLEFANRTGRYLSGNVRLIFGDASSAIEPYSNSFSVASKQPGGFEGGSILAQQPEGQNYHLFENVRPGESRYPCRPFQVPVGSGQKWMVAQSAAGYTPQYRFSCH